jgi:hypothetical protein
MIFSTEKLLSRTRVIKKKRFDYILFRFTHKKKHTLTRRFKELQLTVCIIFYYSCVKFW